MKKVGVLAFILFFSFSLVLVSAANETAQDRAANCLEGKIKGKCASLTFEEQVFSTLGIGLSECKDAIIDKSKNSGECWPSSGCKIKDTALAILALNHAGVSTTKAEEWIAKNNITPTDLEWYLEIDSSSAVSCTISYDTGSAKIKIDADKKIASFSNPCLISAQDSNWMKISSSCLKKKFTVTCDKDFVSTILYKKPSSNVWRVSPSVQQGTASGKTEHSLNFYCYSTSTSCNYEDNLWAALALYKNNQDAKGSLPYLIALAEDNAKYFPETFLYLIGGDNEYLTSIVNAQNPDGYWNLNNQRLYTTAQALLALTPSQSSSDVVTASKTWLEANQEVSGCWGTTKDTGFLLWAAYPSSAPTCTGDGCGGETKPDCVVAGDHYCTSPGDCDPEVNGGNILDEFSCEGRGGMSVCCSRDVRTETCEDKNGEICTGGRVCSEETVSASGTSDCCLGTCQLPTSQCEEDGGSCQSSCLASEEEIDSSCDSGVCCKTKTTPPSSEGKSLWWLWILIILIILVIIGIIFRNQLRMFLFKFKHKGGEPVTKTRPPFFPPSQQPRPIFRPFSPQKPVQRPASKTDSDLDDTFKKLKEMSK